MLEHSEACLDNRPGPPNDMKTNVKRHFLECHSLAEMAITLVVLGVIFLLPVAFLSVVLGLILNLSKHIAIFGPLGLWLFSVVAMWCWFVRVGRSWSEPRLATKEFSYFQWTSIGFVLLLNLTFPSAETAPTINAIRWFLTALFVMANLAYVSLAVAIKAKLPTKILLGLVMSIVVAVLPIWTKWTK
jgi:hypothetical protein